MANSKKRALVLEDDRTQARLYERILAGGSYETILIEDPRDLMESLDSIPVPDIMLLDILLPNMDGVCVLECLESHPVWCSVPAVMMTSTPTAERVQAARQLPIAPEGFLVKPIEPACMLHLLRSVLTSNDPVHLTRRLQRRRRALELSISSDSHHVQGALQQSCQATQELSDRMFKTKKEIQGLKVIQSKLSDLPPDARRSMQELMVTLEREEKLHQVEVKRSEDLRKGILEIKKSIRVKQQSIHDLDRQIHALSSYAGSSPKPAEPTPPDEEKIILSSVGSMQADSGAEEPELEDQAGMSGEILDLGFAQGENSPGRTGTQG